MEETPSRGQGALEKHPDWSILVAQAIQDASNILHAETHLLQINLGASLKAQIDYALLAFAIVAGLICAAICFVTALILGLHDSFRWQPTWPWWAAFIVGGLVFLFLALAVRTIARHSLAPPNASPSPIGIGSA
jgi:Putative Actinobacterial Holin-X, holin superfamily III